MQNQNTAAAEVGADSIIRASDENLEPIEPDGKNIFLYNETVPSVVDALKDFKKLISKLTKSTDVGDYENMNNHIGEKGIKYNYFQSFSLGNAIGDFDDLGTAIGKYSQRCYFKGNIYKKSESDKWLLNVDEIACRFVDSFGFNENYLLGLRSQDLGCWINDINKPSIPNRVKYPWESKKICLQNLDYQNLKEILAGNKEKKKPAIIVNSCNDFLIYSDYKIFKNGVVKKRDIVF